MEKRWRGAHGGFAASVTGADQVGAEANLLAVLSGCDEFRGQRGLFVRYHPWRVNAVRSVTLNMLMLQLGMSTTACTSFAIGESVGGVEQLETSKLARHRGKVCKCRRPCQRASRLVLCRFPARGGAALRGEALRGKHCAGRFSARGPCDRRFSGGVVQSKLRDAALHGVAVLEEASRVNARKRPSRQRRLVESQGG